MPHDPIVDTVRSAREAFAKDHGYDVKQIVDALRKQEVPVGARVVSLPPKRVSTAAVPRKSA